MSESESMDMGWGAIVLIFSNPQFLHFENDIFVKNYIYT